MSLQTRILSAINSIATDVKSLFSNKQNTLISQNNIKALNGNNLLGSGVLVINGARTLTFGGTGTPTVGNDLTPRLVTNYAGFIKWARLSTKTAATGGSFVARIYTSTTASFASPTLLVTLTVVSGQYTITQALNVAIANGTYLRADVVSVNGASDWTLELLQTEA